jgi:hypothetical protein
VLRNNGAHAILLNENEKDPHFAGPSLVQDFGFRDSRCAKRYPLRGAFYP